MKLTFFGAAGEVTGSQHLLESDTLRILLDCGLFQGAGRKPTRRTAHFRCGPRQLDAVILSHAHIDHCGNLPGLFRAGFQGPIYCTPATADLTADHAPRQSTHSAGRRTLPEPARRGGPAPIEPLYGENDVRGAE